MLRSKPPKKNIISHLWCRTGGKVQLPGQEIGCQRKNWFAPGTLAIDMQLFLAPLVLDLISKKKMKLINNEFLALDKPTWH